MHAVSIPGLVFNVGKRLAITAGDGAMHGAALVEVVGILKVMNVIVHGLAGRT
jgi:hypothetical protein